MFRKGWAGVPGKNLQNQTMAIENPPLPGKKKII
jgi:hypothetical protein